MKHETITIKDARRILGKDVSDRLDDMQVYDLIAQLDYIARLYVHKQPKSTK